MAAKRSQLEIEARLSEWGMEMETQSIYDRLIEWGRWVRVRQIQGHCASIEHRYRMRMRADGTPTGWGDWLVSTPPRLMPAIDAIRALEVERCMRFVPEQHREALALCYVYQLQPIYAHRFLRVRYADYERFLGDACAMLANRLRKQKKERICVADNSSRQRTAEILEPLGSGCIGQESRWYPQLQVGIKQ